MAKVLVVEDDTETADYVAVALRREGHSVACAADGSAALRETSAVPPDLVVLDRMLPELDGLTVLRQLRKSGFRAPILLLSAIGEVAGRIEGLDAGADDYLTKPFDVAELRARVAALLRRPPLPEPWSDIRAGDLTINRLSRRVFRGAVAVDLQPREYQILEYLAVRAGAVATRAMLLKDIWGISFDPGTNIVETHMSRLRAKIERDGGQKVIRTVRGVGYVVDSD